ncbi:MAG TPA: ATP-binding cassette domain-containing protein [Micromonosporaceae bacterium]|jgi:ABC-2 type transport system ATP-binding protein
MHNAAVWLPIAGVLLAFFVFCEIQVLVRPAKHLPKIAWALIIVAQIPLGGIAYLILGRGDRPTTETDVTSGEPRIPVERRSAERMDPPVVRTRGLSKVFSGGVGLHAVDVAVPGRGVYGLVGPNGAGKTTLLSLLAGVRRPDAGEIVTDGRILLCPDAPAFEPWLTAAETVRAFSHAADIEHALDVTGLLAAGQRRVAGFSRGMTQRLGLAVVLASDADVLLMDEPTSALDPQGRSEMLDLIAAVGHERAIVFSSHILADVQRVADTVGVLRDGHLLYQGPVAELLDRHTRPSWRLHLRSGGEVLATRLNTLDWVVSVTPEPQGLRVDTTGMRAGETLLAAEVAASGAELIALNPIGADLETVFLDLVEVPA